MSDFRNMEKFLFFWKISLSADVTSRAAESYVYRSLKSVPVNAGKRILESG